MQVVIADAGPLIALACIDQLRLLRDLFQQVLFTEVVAAEIGLAPQDQDDSALPGVDRLQEAHRDGWLTWTESAGIAPYSPLNPGVDAGEASTIALALALRIRGPRCFRSSTIAVAAPRHTGCNCP
jgi:predicted nucleic acid-binding protein